MWQNRRSPPRPKFGRCFGVAHVRVAVGFGREAGYGSWRVGLAGVVEGSGITAAPLALGGAGGEVFSMTRRGKFDVPSAWPHPAGAWWCREMLTKRDGACGHSKERRSSKIIRSNPQQVSRASNQSTPLPNASLLNQLLRFHPHGACFSQEISVPWRRDPRLTASSQGTMHLLSHGELQPTRKGFAPLNVRAPSVFASRVGALGSGLRAAGGPDVRHLSELAPPLDLDLAGRHGD